jgi:hypothetical protein
VTLGADQYGADFVALVNYLAPDRALARERCDRFSEPVFSHMLNPD